jgi:hypothetical protein
MLRDIEKRMTPIEVLLGVFNGLEGLCKKTKMPKNSNGYFLNCPFSKDTVTIPR